jgi:hypothetical protein
MSKAARKLFYEGAKFAFLGVDAEYDDFMETIVIYSEPHQIASIIEDDDNDGFSFDIDIWGYENHLKMKFNALDFK